MQNEPVNPLLRTCTAPEFCGACRNCIGDDSGPKCDGSGVNPKQDPSRPGSALCPGCSSCRPDEGKQECSTCGLTCTPEEETSEATGVVIGQAVERISSLNFVARDYKTGLLRNAYASDVDGLHNSCTRRICDPCIEKIEASARLEGAEAVLRGVEEVKEAFIEQHNLGNVKPWNGGAEALLACEKSARAVVASIREGK